MFDFRCSIGFSIVDLGFISDLLILKCDIFHFLVLIDKQKMKDETANRKQVNPSGCWD